MSALLPPDTIKARLEQLGNDWSVDQQRQQIEKTFHFNDYYQAMAFANTVAWVAHQQDHHPEMLIRYNSCHVTYTTHDAKGLTERDFNSALTIEKLLKKNLWPNAD
jgi:4a-hydroxytetrahydrobiopterin dehydratase